MNYKDINDYELLSYIGEKNEEANDLLFQKYKPFIISLAKSYLNKSHNQGFDINDLIQEGMIGLSYAIQSFNQDKEASFYTYAKTCIERKMISALIGSGRLKNKILNESLSFENSDDNYNFEHLLSDNSINPEKLVMNNEIELETINNIKQILTELENQVFELKISGFDYHEIAEMLALDSKTIDNALQRIKQKIRKQINI